MHLDRKSAYNVGVSITLPGILSNDFGTYTGCPMWGLFSDAFKTGAITVKINYVGHHIKY